MINLQDIEAARERLGSSVYKTPCARSEMLSRTTGQSIFLKLENLQMTGSFKERGALNKIATLTPEQGARGVVAASAGSAPRWCCMARTMTRPVRRRRVTVKPRA